MSQSNEQGETIMTKLLSDKELRDQILEILGNSIGDIADDADDIVALINTQKRLYADMVIGEDENEHYEDLTTHLNPSALARNSLRAEQRAKLKEVMGGER